MTQKRAGISIFYQKTSKTKVVSKVKDCLLLIVCQYSIEVSTINETMAVPSVAMAKVGRRVFVVGVGMTKVSTCTHQMIIDINFIL